VASGAAWLDWTWAGAVVLTALFQGSTNFTEELTLKKYPSYAAYQKTTSRLIPWFPRAASRGAV
jgi:steroid 5-alpha reductase family enzyme